MAETIFKASDLCKNYKNTFALDHVDMEIHRGEIYGFIGENGAGKTTTLRIITGLAYPSAGAINLFGCTEEKELNQQRKRIGCTIEGPAVYPDLSARQNLEVQRIQRGIPGKKCVDEILETVKLTNTGSKKAGDFSMGMKQRLGLGIALLGKPEFLILDEPLNGLDPMGIVEIRELIKQLNKERNMTVLISSHILSELSQLATCYGIIHQGKMLEQISAKELNEKCKKHIRIQTNNVAKAAVILEAQLHTSKFEIFPGNIIQLYDFLDDIGKVSAALSAGNVSIEEISPHGDSLETYFTHLIGGESHD